MYPEARNWFVVMDTRLPAHGFAVRRAGKAGIEAYFRSSEFFEFQISSFEPPYQHRQL